MVPPRSTSSAAVRLAPEVCCRSLHMLLHEIMHIHHDHCNVLSHGCLAADNDMAVCRASQCRAT